MELTECEAAFCRQAFRIACPQHGGIGRPGGFRCCHLREGFIRDTLNNSSAAGQRSFSSIRGVPKTGNPYRIPPFSEPSAGEKSLAASSCRIIQSFPKKSCHFKRNGRLFLFHCAKLLLLPQTLPQFPHQREQPHQIHQQHKRCKADHHRCMVYRQHHPNQQPGHCNANEDCPGDGADGLGAALLQVKQFVPGHKSLLFHISAGQSQSSYRPCAGSFPRHSLRALLRSGKRLPGTPYPSAGG